MQKNVFFHTMSRLLLLTTLLYIDCTLLQKQHAVITPDSSKKNNQEGNNFSLNGKIIKNLSITPALFNPTLGGSTELCYALTTDGKVSIDIVDEDGFHIRKLINNESRKKNTLYQEKWDGNDDHGTIVPDEAYFPVATFTGPAEYDTINPILCSGGNKVTARNLAYNQTEKIITYALEVPARVMLRIGIKSGALLNTLVDLEPRTAGVITEYWNGKDGDNIQDLFLQDESISIVAVGYVLPSPCVISFGNTAIDYKKYRYQNDPLLKKRFIPDSTKLDNSKISKHFLKTRIIDHAPHINITFPENQDKDETGSIILKEKAVVRIEIDHLDALYYPKQFEMSFFVENNQYADENNGYSPYTWVWNLSDINAGNHILTVNIGTAEDRIGFKSVKVTVVKQ